MILIAGAFWLNFLPSVSFSQTICDPSGNVIIYSNYDGGYLNISVDENIPDLKIGLVSYESGSVTISGAYANNITEIRYVGYNSTNNHCGYTAPSIIIGAPAGTDSIIPYPVSTINNPNGNNHIICNYSCDTSSSQGGCNTPNQIEHYFLQNFGGSLRFHHTQYGCWTGTQNTSDGGNCCISDMVTGIEGSDPMHGLIIYPNPFGEVTNIEFNNKHSNTYTLYVYNFVGERIIKEDNITNNRIRLERSELSPGTYFIELVSAYESLRAKVIIE